jgi:tetratricopeptide (TPR) repeat protein
MKKIFKIIAFIFFVPNILLAKSQFIQDGINLYNNKKFEEAKFKFEQDIIFNPKSEISYLFLAKIFNKQENKKLEEQNLNTVILLNPKNEEAIYNLVKLKLNSSDYKKSKELNKTLKSICSNFCSQSDELKTEIENLSKK